MKHNFLIKLISTIINFTLSIIIGILLPKTIGPKDYGDYSYIISIYSFFFQLLMFSSSTAYVYFLSVKKYNVKEINTIYFSFLFLICMMITALTSFLLWNDLTINFLFSGINNKNLVYLALFLSVLMSFQERFIEYSDSTSQTIKSEKIKLISKFLLSLSVIVFVFFKKLTIYNFLITSIFSIVLFIFMFIKLVVFNFALVSKKKAKKIVIDIFNYVKPLIAFTFISSIYSFIGKYTIQSTGGSFEQGYYNFASQIALLPVILITSIMAIYMSEMTKKFQENDILGVKNIFSNNIFKIYSIHAFFSFFVLINTKQVILFTVGDSFIEATNTLKLLSIFSLMHTFGLLSGNLFHSSGRNKLYSVINSSTMIVGIIYILYFLVNDKIDATHLAAIITVLYSIRVGVQLYYNLIYLKIEKIKFIIDFIIVSLVIFGALKSISLIFESLLLNLFFSLFVITIINFICGDYLDLKKIKLK